MFAFEVYLLHYTCVFSYRGTVSPGNRPFDLDGWTDLCLPDPTSINPYNFTFDTIWPTTQCFWVRLYLYSWSVWVKCLQVRCLKTVYQTHRGSITKGKWMKPRKKYCIELPGETRNWSTLSRRWIDSACEIHVKHSVNEENKQMFKRVCTKWFDFSLNRNL